MLFSIERDELKTAIDIASLAVGSESDSYENKIKFEVSPDEVTLRTTDGNAFLFVPAQPIDVAHQEPFLLEADRLSQWLKHMPSGEIEVSRDESDIVMSQGGKVGRFVRYDAVNFPDLSDQVGDGSEIMDVPADRFRNMLEFSESFTDEAEDGTSPRAWKEVVELWDGQAIASDVDCLSYGYDPQLAPDCVEVTEETASDILSVADRYNEDTQSSSDEVFDRGDLVFETDDGFRIYPNTVFRLFEQADTDMDLFELIPESNEDCFSPFRIVKSDLSTLLSFLKKVKGVGVKVFRQDQIYAVQTEDGSLFGFRRSHHELPSFMGLIFDHGWEPHRWTMDVDEFLSGLSALKATAPDNTRTVTLSFDHSGDSEEIVLEMDSEGGGDPSQFPIPVDVISGCGDVNVDIGFERIEEAFGEYKGFDSDELEFSMTFDEGYLKVANYTDDDDLQGPDPDPVMLTQIVLSRR
jgi:hypothetical protein